MGTFISVLILIVCFLLVLVVLIQNAKGGGIASNFAASNQIMGVKKQTELVEKITWWLAIGLLVLSIFSASFTGRPSGPGGNSKQPVTKGAEVPGLNTQPAGPANQGGPQQQPMQQGKPGKP